MTETTLRIGVVEPLRSTASKPDSRGQPILVGGKGRVSPICFREVGIWPIPNCGSGLSGEGDENENCRNDEPSEVCVAFHKFFELLIARAASNAPLHWLLSDPPSRFPAAIELTAHMLTCFAVRSQGNFAKKGALGGLWLGPLCHLR